jgi:hypothetical protein
MSSVNRIACRIALVAAAGLAVAGCENMKGNDVVANRGGYDLRDGVTKHNVITTNLEPGDRASITYLGTKPVQATWDRHYLAGTDQSAGWQWVALDPDGRYEFRPVK